MSAVMTEKNILEPLEINSSDSNQTKLVNISKKVLDECKELIKLKSNTTSPTKTNLTKKFSPKTSLDNVVQDIKNALGQLKEPKSNSKNSVRNHLDMKLEKKEFFKYEIEKKKKKQQDNQKVLPQKNSSQIQRKSNTTSSQIIKKPSHNPMSTGSVNKMKQRVSTTAKIPSSSKNEVKNFKQEVIINSNQILNNDMKQKSGKDMKNLMNAAAIVDSVKTNKIPIINVGSIIEQKLASTNNLDVVPVNKTENVESPEGKKIDPACEKSNNSNEKKVIKPPPRPKNSQIINSSMKFPKSQTTSNLIRKSPACPSKNFVNLKNTGGNNKVIGQTKNPPVKTNVVKPNRSVLQSTSQFQNNGPLANVKTSSINASHTSENVKTLFKSNVGSSSNFRPVSARNSSLQRRDSLARNSQRRMLSAPPRAISSLLSSRMDSVTSYTSYITKTNPSGSVNALREEVNRAIRDRKTFTVRGNFPAVRKALLKRGWVEKFHLSYRERLEMDVISLKSKAINDVDVASHAADLNETCKKLIKSRMLGNHQVDFYWATNLEAFKINPDRVKLTKINKFRRDVFSYTSKQGLCDAAKKAYWFNFPGVACLNHPRTYALAKNGESADFKKDFRRTAAMSLLKWVIRSHETKEFKIISISGKIPVEVFQFAVNECYKMLIEATNQDIDEPIKPATDEEWTQFLEYFYKILHIGNHFKLCAKESEASIVEKSTYLINELTPHYPHIKMDGTMNIWILKPTTGSQGKGIHICRTLQYILQTIKNNSTVRYVAQKYIERPLLIFNTKFDIRQWFLISSAVPLTIWMYKECYLRFSSQTYNLRKLHESVHLTNNSVQQRYKNLSHDITLPNYNMWDSVQFRNYLSNIGYPDIYWKTIYKGMKECIIGAVMVHQDKIDKRRNCFELYGADFMLTEDFQPWLIEINSCPALYGSTPITAKMCPQVLEDTIKVVIDRANNPNAKTGLFELIYRQLNMHCNNNENVSNFKVSGVPLSKEYFCNENEIKPAKPLMKISKSFEVVKKKSTIQKSYSVTSVKDVKKTLENLLKFIQDEKKKRLNLKLVHTGIDPIELCMEKFDQKINVCSSVSMSFSYLKTQLSDLIEYDGEIEITEDDEKIIETTLITLKDKKKTEFIRNLLEILERIVQKIPRSIQN